MTKEELIKVFSAYLPYGLIGVLEPQKEQVELTAIFCDKFNIPEVGINYSGAYAIGRFKPILYDLSYLTKEIEHEGEKFIPIVELLKIKFPNQVGRYAETDFSTEGHPNAWFKVSAAKNIMLPIFNLEDQSQWIFQKLIEWHFNVYMLEDSEFINKATLNK